MIGFYIFKYSMYVFVVGCIGLAAYLNDKIVASIFLFGCYLLLRGLTPKTFHHNNFFWCVFWSIVMFYVAIPMTLPLYVSILSSIVVGCIIDLILYYIQDYIDFRIKEEEAKRFNIDTCTTEELIEKCKIKGFSQQDIDQCIIIFKSGLKGENLYNKLCYCARQVKNLRKKYKKLLTE